MNHLRLNLFLNNSFLILNFFDTNFVVKILQLNVKGFDNNFSYLVIGAKKESVLIDPTGDKKIIENAIKKSKARLVLLLTTHSHPDHKELLNYFLQKNISLKNFKALKKEPFFVIAGLKIKTIFTPGHTKDSVCFLIENNLFTGDTLFVKGVGTTDYGGNKKQLKNSIELLSSFDKKIIVWPGHNYNGVKSTLGEAISNSHINPSEKTLEKIQKKVLEYEKKV